MKIELCNKKIDDISADLKIVFIINKDINHDFVGHKDEFEFFKFDGSTSLLLGDKRVLYVGIKSLCENELRLGSAKAYAAIKSYDVKSVKIASYICGCQKMSFAALVEGFLLKMSQFDRYKSDKSACKLAEIFISTQEYNDKKVDEEVANLGIKFGIITSEATNFAKEKINEIPQIYTPLKMAEDAEILASAYDEIECKIYDEEYLKDENMGAFLAVNAASPIPPRLIHLKYTPKNGSKKRVCFVGKGLTYDSGGLSLKPADYMVTMKSDKSGALAAMATIKGVASLGLDIEVHAVLGATENMLGANSFKPDDILMSRSGVSIEVRNTDAEGRLVLADCLSWAQDKIAPDLLIDMATLTGACVVGLGEYTSAIMGQNFDLGMTYKNYSKKSGEFFTVLEFNDYLKELIKSSVADVSNTSSSRYGGALTAGAFLEKFIKPQFLDKWLHLDIAGPAYVEKEWGYNTFGASGAAVRANLYFLNKLSRES